MLYIVLSNKLGQTVHLVVLLHTSFELIYDLICFTYNPKKRSASGNKTHQYTGHLKTNSSIDLVNWWLPVSHLIVVLKMYNLPAYQMCDKQVPRQDNIKLKRV